ncbi:hypothetical protein U1Q18_044743 [Sarracenia purpurea var. burkii]
MAKLRAEVRMSSGVFATCGQSRKLTSFVVVRSSACRCATNAHQRGRGDMYSLLASFPFPLLPDRRSGVRGRGLEPEHFGSFEVVRKTSRLKDALHWQWRCQSLMFASARKACLAPDSSDRRNVLRRYCNRTLTRALVASASPNQSLGFEAKMVTYMLAETAWQSAPVIVQDVSGHRLCSIPRNFLADSRVDLVTLLSTLVRMCVVEDGFLVDQAGDEVTKASQCEAGMLVWRCSGEAMLSHDCRSTVLCLFRCTDASIVSCSFVRGPRFKFANRSPTANDETSTMSNSKRSTTQQVSR